MTLTVDPFKHKSVQKFELPSVYIAEILNRISFATGKMVKLVWPDSSRGYGNSPHDDKALALYHSEYTKVNRLEQEWAELLYKMRDDFIDEQKINQTGIVTTGIKISEGFAHNGPNGYSYLKPDQEPIHIYKIKFNNEDTRLAFAEFLEKSGFADALHSFIEVPKAGKKHWIPMT